MKTTFIAVAALLTLGALPALAGEGNGEPFGLQTSGIVTTYADRSADTGSNAYPDVTGRPGSALAVYAGVLSSDTGSEAAVQTANSLPVGALPVDGRAYANLGAPTQTQAVRTAVRIAPRS